MLASAEREMF